MPIIKVVPMPGPSGTGSADIADFVFENDGDGQSTITIHNHDMRIQTTRDTDEDSDIDINSADDVWITANDSIEITSVTDDVRVYTNDGEHEWSFKQNGELSLPSTNAAIGSGFDGNIITDSRTATFYADYADTSNGINNSEAVYLPVNEDTQWFSNNTYSTTTITFADSTSVQTLAIYDATSQGTAAMVFQWSGPITKTFEETYPLVVTGNVTQPKAYVSIIANNAEWLFAGDNKLEFPANGSISNLEASSGDGNGYDTIKIVPDAEREQYDQYLIIDPTTPNHIHIRAGGTQDASNAELILGAEEAHVRVVDYNKTVNILANDVNISSLASPSALNINTYSGAIVNSHRTSGYADGDKVVATLGDLPTGATGSFTSADGKTITVTNGIITGIE